MIYHTLKSFKAYTFGVCLLLVMGCKQKSEQYSINTAEVSKAIEQLFILNSNKAIAHLDSLTAVTALIHKQYHYKAARKAFKHLEPILAYVDKHNFKTLNAPNIIAVKGEESDDTRLVNPFGFQVIEETLYDAPLDTIALHQLITKTSKRLQLIKNNVVIQLKPYHIIWLLRDEITRIATTGITGFDSPVLNQSLIESTYAYTTLIDILKINAARFNSEILLEKAVKTIAAAQTALQGDFNSFDRYNFIKQHTHKQLELLVEIQNDWRVKFPFEMALSNSMTGLFNRNSLNTTYFTDYNSDTLNLSQKIAFGKALFNDTSLSKDHNMSCASCHVEDLAFTDGKRFFNAKQTRNTPTLTYSSYQHSYFMDARTGSLEGQIIGVVNNHNEFNMSMDAIVKRVLNNTYYAQQMDSLYQNKRMDYNIRHAIASYVRQLNPFNSKFDKNIRNEIATLTSQEIQGFNVFMGKALCATCHFAPIFNGTVPPDFKDTELEAIGVPHTKDTIHPVISKDLGRYYVYKTKARTHFFKTPTLRNIALTAPYMHNGVYTTLEEVVAFYNKGGGKGLGLNLAHQTLPFDNLSLSKTEQNALVAFMKTLTDEKTTR